MIPMLGALDIDVNPMCHPPSPMADTRAPVRPSRRYGISAARGSDCHNDLNRRPSPGWPTRVSCQDVARLGGADERVRVLLEHEAFRHEFLCGLPDSPHEPLVIRISLFE